MVSNTSNASVQKVKAGESTGLSPTRSTEQVPGRPRLHRPCLKKKKKPKCRKSPTWCYMPVVLALKRQRLENFDKFEASLRYIEFQTKKTKQKKTNKQTKTIQAKRWKLVQWSITPVPRMHPRGSCGRLSRWWGSGWRQVLLQ